MVPSTRLLADSKVESNTISLNAFMNATKLTVALLFMLMLAGISGSLIWLMAYYTKVPGHEMESGMSAIGAMVCLLPAWHLCFGVLDKNDK